MVYSSYSVGKNMKAVSKLNVEARTLEHLLIHRMDEVRINQYDSDLIAVNTGIPEPPQIDIFSVKGNKIIQAIDSSGNENGPEIHLMCDEMVTRKVYEKKEKHRVMGSEGLYSNWIPVKDVCVEIHHAYQFVSQRTPCPWCTLPMEI